MQSLHNMVNMVQVIHKKQLNIVITGGNSGIGLQTAKALYLDGNNVIFGSRTQQKNTEALNLIKQQIGGTLGTIISYPLDLSEKQSIFNFAQFVKNQFAMLKCGHLDILINNAASFIKQKQLSQLGIEKMMTTNFCGHFYLTHLLFPLLIKSQEARIINVAADGYKYFASKDPYKDLPYIYKKFNQNQAVSNSKLALIHFTIRLNQIIQANQLYCNRIKVMCLHPGLVRTNIFKNMNGFMGVCLRFINSYGFFGKSPKQGAKTTLYLATAPFAQLLSGRYYKEQKVEQYNEVALDQKLMEQIWRLASQFYQIKKPFQML